MAFRIRPVPSKASGFFPLFPLLRIPRATKTGKDPLAFALSFGVFPGLSQGNFPTTHGGLYA